MTRNDLFQSQRGSSGLGELLGGGDRSGDVELLRRFARGSRAGRLPGGVPPDRRAALQGLAAVQNGASSSPGGGGSSCPLPPPPPPCRAISASIAARSTRSLSCQRLLLGSLSVRLQPFA